MVTQNVLNLMMNNTHGLKKTSVLGFSAKYVPKNLKAMLRGMSPTELLIQMKEMMDGMCNLLKSHIHITEHSKLTKRLRNWRQF